MSGFFTESAKKEQKFLKENYPKLWLRYDEYSGYICINDEDYKGSNLIKQEVR